MFGWNENEDFVKRYDDLTLVHCDTESDFNKGSNGFDRKVSFRLIPSPLHSWNWVETGYNIPVKTLQLFTF